MRIKFRAVDLKSLHARRITRADFDAIVETLLRRIAKPHSEALFGELLVTEVIGEAENARHVTTAHFGGRFADLAIERRRFFR
jgi:hypothetical protein